MSDDKKNSDYLTDRELRYKARKTRTSSVASEEPVDEVVEFKSFAPIRRKKTNLRLDLPPGPYRTALSSPGRPKTPSSENLEVLDSVSSTGRISPLAQVITCMRTDLLVSSFSSTSSLPETVKNYSKLGDRRCYLSLAQRDINSRNKSKSIMADNIYRIIPTFDGTGSPKRFIELAERALELETEGVARQNLFSAVLCKLDGVAYDVGKKSKDMAALKKDLNNRFLPAQSLEGVERKICQLKFDSKLETIEDYIDRAEKLKSTLTAIVKEVYELDDVKATEIAEYKITRYFIKGLDYLSRSSLNVLGLKTLATASEKIRQIIYMDEIQSVDDNVLFLPQYNVQQPQTLPCVVPQYLAQPSAGSQYMLPQTVAQPMQQYTPPMQQYAQPMQPFAQPMQPYVQPQQQYAQPMQQFAQQQQFPVQTAQYNYSEPQFTNYRGRENVNTGVRNNNNGYGNKNFGFGNNNNNRANNFSRPQNNQYRGNTGNNNNNSGNQRGISQYNSNNNYRNSGGNRDNRESRVYGRNSASNGQANKTNGMDDLTNSMGNLNVRTNSREGLPSGMRNVVSKN